MKNTLKLSKSLKVSNAQGDVELQKLPYDFESMTAKEKLNAIKK